MATKPTKTPVYKLTTNDVIVSTVANIPHDNLETNIDAILDYLNNTNIVESVAGHSPDASGNVTLSKSDVGLNNVSNALQLVAANNLSDVPDNTLAISNLGIDTLLDAKADKTSLSVVATSGLFNDLLSKPTTVGGYGITNAYTQTEVDSLLNGKVDNSGDSLSGVYVFTSGIKTSGGSPAPDATSIPTDGIEWSFDTDSFWLYGIEDTVGDNSSLVLRLGDNAGDGFRIESRDGTLLTQLLYITGDGTFTYRNNDIWHKGNLTNLNQLINGPGYITGITGTMVNSALGYTAADDADLASYALLSGASFTGAISAPNLSGTNTGDQDLSGYALLSGADFTGAISATNLSGTNTGDQDLSPYALSSAIPTNNNQLTNGAGYITGITGTMVNTALGYTAANSADLFSGSYTDLTSKPFIPTDNTQIGNGAGYAFASSVPTNNNQLTNGRGFITGTGPDISSPHLSGNIWLDISSGTAFYITVGSTFHINYYNNNTYAGTPMSMTTGGHVTFSGDVTANSDARLKTNIRTINDALDRVKRMRGVFFEKDGKTGTGVVAQEIRKVLPEAVHGNDGESEYLSVAYGNIVGVLIESIKELESRITELER